MTLAAIGWSLFSVTGLLTLLIVGGLWSLVRPLSRGPRRVLLIVIAAYSVAAYYPLSAMLARLVGAGFHPLTREDVPPGRSVVVLLGSGSATFSDWTGGSMSLPDPIGTERTLEAARAYRLIGADWIISSGGGPEVRGRAEASGQTMRTALEQLGVPGDRVLAETQSRDTREEAIVVAGMLPALHADHVILVTSQLHMRRSLLVFRAAGVPAIPAIARDSNGFGRLPLTLPSGMGLSLFSQVAHELGGLVVYGLRGDF